MISGAGFSHTQVLSDVCDILKECGAHAKSCLNSDQIVVAKKSAHDFVTNVDKDVELKIKVHLKRLYPDFAFFGEETGGLFSDYTWVVDPIDGTSNFARKAPFWCISVALYQKTEPLLGAVYDPNLGEVFSAIRGSGAALNGRPLELKAGKSLEASTICFGLTHKLPPRKTLNVISNLVNLGASLRAQGAGALSICHVAADRQDGFYEEAIHIWDTAAAALILTEAGGWIEDCWDSFEPDKAFRIAVGVKSNQNDFLRCLEDEA